MRAKEVGLALALIGGSALVSRPLAAEHPPLVKAEGTACTTCHRDLLEAAGSVHSPAVDDCTTCHGVTVAAAGTTVAMTAEEPALCLTCHDGMTNNFEGGLASPHAPVMDSCVFCHDPHASAEASLLLYPPQDLCTVCHDRADLEDSHGGQLTAATDCTRCHAPHGSDSPRMLIGSKLHAPFDSGSCNACHRKPFGERIRLLARGERLCTACHGEVIGAAGAAGSVHAALEGERGRAGCLSCHDPHLSDRSSLLRASATDLCADCHEPIVAAAMAPTGHAAAADDCLGCHRPHAASEGALLDEPARELCGFCHDTADEGLKRSHLGADLDRLDCLSCHSPHGAGNAGLLAANLHAPVEDGCEICHESTHDDLAEGGGSELCLICHDDIGEAASDAAVHHGALEVAVCADCHNPHAAGQDRLLRLPGAGVCRDCHEDQSPAPGEVAHGVIDLIGCHACHEPHGGERAKLLRRSGPELCLACHDPRAVRSQAGDSTVELMDRFRVPADRVRSMTTLRLSMDGKTGHPVTDHRVLGVPTPEELKRAGTDFDSEFTCLTCHDPHKGRSRSLLRWGAASGAEACAHCHVK